MTNIQDAESQPLINHNHHNHNHNHHNHNHNHHNHSQHSHHNHHHNNNNNNVSPVKNETKLTITKPSTTTTTTSSDTNKRRMSSLDVARGITIFGMVLVDNQGGPDVIWPLKETSWNGLSTADLIFPSFLFICGFSVALALKNSTNTRSTWYNIIRRTFLLFFIQCFLNLMAHHFVFQSFRIMGVLQRIAICYFLSCFSFLCLPVFLQRVFLLCTTVTYISVMYALPVPGCGKGVLTPTCNAGSYIDNKVFGPNMIHPNDPEGLLSTLSAFITTWMGLEFGRVFTSYFRKYDYSNVDLIIRWIIMIVLFFIPAIALGATVMPFNKLIWSFSFALFTVGAGGLLITVVYILVDVIQWGCKVRRIVDTIVKPFIWIGMNPITIYSLMIFIEIILMFYIKTSNGTYLWQRSYEVLFLSWLKNGYLASTVFSLGWFIFFDLIAYLMYRNKIFIKL